MSLILEALKRSENERLSKSNKASSLVTSSFGDTSKEEKKNWIPQFLIIALAVNAVLLGGLYLSSKNQPDESLAVIDTQEENVIAIEQQQTTAFEITKQQPVLAAKKVNNRSVKAATPLAEELVKSEPISTSESTRSSWNKETVAKNAAPSIPADFAMIETEETVPELTNTAPVLLREVSNDSLAEQLENYEINTHIYNADDPARSFVLLNMEKYRVGDKLNNTDYEIADITADGVVVDHGSGQVLISAN